MYMYTHKKIHMQNDYILIVLLLFTLSFNCFIYCLFKKFIIFSLFYDCYLIS